MAADLSRLFTAYEGAVERCYTSGNTVESIEQFNEARTALLAAIAEIVEERDKFKSALEQFARIKLNE